MIHTIWKSSKSWGGG